MGFFNRFNLSVSITAGIITLLVFFLGIQKCSDLIPNRYNKIIGFHKMSFQVTECSDDKFAQGDLTGYYDVEFKREGRIIQGSGVKHSETFHGKFMRYSKNFKVDIVGEIVNGVLVAKVYEDNGKQTHKVEGSMRLNLNTMEGTMNTNFYNCFGIIRIQK
ncbi:MAG: hypothetical protein GC181_16435 [Bacteroidetes bacterium]|nr:hypothetical protein [Bacteroidota bacterium]